MNDSEFISDTFPRFRTVEVGNRIVAEWLAYIWRADAEAKERGSTKPFSGRPVLADLPDGGWSETYETGATVVGSRSTVTVKCPIVLGEP